MALFIERFLQQKSPLQCPWFWCCARPADHINRRPKILSPSNGRGAGRMNGLLWSRLCDESITRCAPLPPLLLLLVPLWSPRVTPEVRNRKQSLRGRLLSYPGTFPEWEAKGREGATLRLFRESLSLN